MLIASSILAPIIKENIFENWEDHLREQNSEIEKCVNNRFEKLEYGLIQKVELIKTFVMDNVNESSALGHSLHDLVNSKQFGQNYVEVYNNDTNIIAWSERNSSYNIDLFNEDFASGELYFRMNPMATFLALHDSVEECIVVIGTIVEKNFKINNEYIANVSWEQDLSRQFNTEFEINYERKYEDNKDGTKHSFPIYNNFNNTIATVVFQKPSREIYLTNVDKSIYTFQSLLLLVIYILFGISLYNSWIKSKTKIVRLTYVSLTLIVFRVLLNLMDFPQSLIHLQIDNPMYFSSRFLFGLVSSPFEYFLTAATIVYICVRYYRYLKDEKLSEKKSSTAVILIYSVIILIIYLVFLRGFGATVRSVVFDSSIRYFKYPTIIPDIPTLVMLLNLLLTGYASLLFSLILLRVLIGKFSGNSRRLITYFFLLFLIFQFVGMIYDWYQHQPQGTPLIRVTYITLTFILAFYIFIREKRSLINHIYILFASSILVISLLNFYNSDLERKSLKITANEITRSEESLIRYLAIETILSASNDPEVLAFLADSTCNFDALAFRIWSNSTLENEALSSNVNIISVEHELLGSFAFKYSENFLWDWERLNFIDNEIELKTILAQDGSSEIIRAVAPFETEGKLLAYLEISIFHDAFSLGFEDTPEFFSSSKAITNTPININQLKIFDFHDSQLVNYFTDLILSENEASKIVNAEFTRYDEAWLNIPINGINHVIFAKRTNELGFDRVLAVALAEKDVSWNLFDFFKLFFIHSLYISLLLFLMYVFYFRKEFKVRYSFRAQLLAAFLFISIIPLIVLAVYFRSLTDQKNIDAIYYKLGKRADSIEEYINRYAGIPGLTIDEIYTNATNDLGINFTIFDDTKLEYSSSMIYYDIGLIPKLLNSKIYHDLVQSGLQEYVVEESIEGFKYHSFYHKARLVGEDKLVKVSDLFNSIQLPMTGTEVDVFLFGSYSFAVILVVILSTLLANQIASPIRRLTRATKSVAGGDLNVRVYDTSRGEIKDLIEGFNDMVQELKRTQNEMAEMEREVAWKEMAKQVAHEIKNPLTPMRLSVQQLVTAYKDKSDKFDAIFEKVTDTVIRQIDTLKNIASEFSSFARMPNLRIQNIDIEKVITQSINLFSDENVKIDYKSSGWEPIVKGDEEQLQRLLVNLLRNSIQAEATEIEINCRCFSDKYSVKISDNGKGISREYVEKIFDDNFTTKIGGMGLGLSMAKRYMESVHGKIFIETTSSSGTTIVLEFPVVNK